VGGGGGGVVVFCWGGGFPDPADSAVVAPLVRLVILSVRNSG